MKSGCFVCGGDRHLRGDFGRQPVCNRFLAASQVDGYRHRLRLMQCDRCGLLQLAEGWPAAEVRPRLEWISYNEPDRHLDALCASLAALPGLARDAFVAGLSYKDTPVLERLARRGFAHTRTLSLADDLGIAERGAGMETIQARLDLALAERLAARHGRPDLLVVRHLLEHSNDVAATVAALRAWVKPGGYLAIEVPDSAQTFADLDYSTLWEEHVLYFTEPTLRAAIPQLGLRLVELQRHAYPLEDCLLAIAKNEPTRSKLPLQPASPDAEQMLGFDFHTRHADVAGRWQDYLRNQGARGCGKIALFGAGHRAATFVNLLGLGELIDCAIDDDPRKKDLTLPGSSLPILGSASLVDRGIGLCLMALSPEAEEKVLGRHAEFVRRGGRLESIYPRSAHASPAARALEFAR